MKKISFESLRDLKKRDGGLAASEVTAQRSRYGSNEIVEVTGNPWLELALDTFKDPMIWFLIGIGTVFTFLGDRSEAVVLFIAILPLVFMDAFLHWRTQASTSGLKGQLASQVSVTRDSRVITIDSRELVPGDLIAAASGLFLPADGIFENATDLQIDESALTGEAFPIHKQSTRLDPFALAQSDEVALPPETLGYAGTRVLTGHGHLRILFTGQRTAYGEIVKSVSSMPHERTPLQKSITKLVQTLTLSAAAFCLLLAGVRIYQGRGWLDALLSAATLAVAAIPEEFPVVFTFFLGVGVYRLAKKRALVRRAVSVENIGRVTYICTDKTGTITRGNLTLTHLDPVKGLTELDLLRAALTASNPSGADPVDQAIQEIAHARGLSAPPRLHVFPFTEDRKCETAITQEESPHAYVKGAPRTVLLKSSLSQGEREVWIKTTAKWAREGHKVLACARRALTPAEQKEKGEPEGGYEFCGLLAFEDPPRPEVAGAMSYCRKNRIGVLMITGDHPDTASAIAKEVGLGEKNPVVFSAEIEPEKLETEWLDRNPGFLRTLDVVARCTPIQKLRIVTALKKAGELVAVTGDGVNDVPALKAADIGIAMGERGTRSAKEVSSIILADDNFRTIINAIMEGRQLFKNLQLSFEYLLLVHIPLVLTAALIPLFGFPLLYLPVHIVWLELIIHPTALFAFQENAPSTSAHARDQKGDGKSFFSRADTIRVVLVGSGLTVALGFSFLSGLNENSDVNHARAKVLAILTLWSAGLVAYFTRLKTRASRVVAGATVLSSILLIQTPPLAQLFHLSPLHGPDWLTTLVVIAAFTGVLIRLKIRSRSPIRPM